MILASSSPRRREILEMFGFQFEVISPNIDEAAIRTSYQLSDKNERDLCLKELALAKARDISSPGLIIACDTMVFSDRPMGKPKDDEEARHMLLSLAGKKHEVVSGFAILGGEEVINLTVSSIVEFISLDEEYERFVNYYVAGGYSKGKAGAYGIQDQGAYFIKSIEGDFYNIMGLPMEAVRHIRKMGHKD